MVKVFVAKVSQHSLPNHIATLHYLPEDPKNFHRTLVERVTSFHGYGTYTLTREQYRHEKRGFKLVCTVRVMPEGMTILRYDPQHPAFEAWTGKRLWYEREGAAQRFMRFPKHQVTQSVRSTVTQFGGHVRRQKSRSVRDWGQLIGGLLQQQSNR